MFEFNYSITEEDYVRFNEHHALTSEAGKKGLLAYRCVIPIISLCFIFVIWAISKDWTLVIIETVFLGILSLVWLLLSKKSYLRSLRRNIKIIKKNGKLPYSTESTLSFGDTTFTDSSKSISTTYDYSAIEAVWVTPTDIYIYTSSIQAVLMPFTIFSSVDEINSFIGFLSTKVDPSKFKHQ